MNTLFDNFETLKGNSSSKETFSSNPVSNILITLATVAFIFSLSTQLLVLGVVAVIAIGISVVQMMRRAKAKQAILKKFGWISGTNDGAITPLLQNTYKSLPAGTPRVFDEIVGHFNDETFYMSQYSATTGSGKHRNTVTVNVLIVKLERHIPITFSLMKENIFSFGEDIQFESIEFNKEFIVQFKPEEKQHIMKLITPSMQMLLLDISKMCNLRSVEVVENTLMFTYAKDIFYTFGMTPTMSDAQMTTVTEKINKMFSFADQISDIFDK